MIWPVNAIDQHDSIQFVGFPITEVAENEIGRCQKDTLHLSSNPPPVLISLIYQT